MKHARTREGKEDGGSVNEYTPHLIDQGGTSLPLSPPLTVVNVYSYISHHHSISHRGIQLFQSES